MDSQLLTPREALHRLREGNRRFVSDQAEHPRRAFDLRKQLAREGQAPYAAVLACSDSRIPVEILFDCGFGDIFCIRNAGNTYTPAVQGAIEFAAGFLKVPLILVMGHSLCGAVSAVAEGANLPQQMDQSVVQPIRAAARELSAHQASDPNVLIEANVHHTAGRIIAGSAAVQAGLASGTLSLAGAVCDTSSTKVHWLDLRIT